MNFKRNEVMLLIQISGKKKDMAHEEGKWRIKEIRKIDKKVVIVGRWPAGTKYLSCPWFAYYTVKRYPLRACVGKFYAWQKYQTI